MTPDHTVPEVHVAGPIADCGEQLGEIWRDVLHDGADRVPPSSRPWWREPAMLELIERYAPHLPDLYRGMAKGAGLAEDRVGTRAVGRDGGCTSFAIAPGATAGGVPMSGQTKDTPVDRIARYRVLRLACTDAPGALTLTYPGWIFGHGFVSGGCAIFRNSLYAPQPVRGLKYTVFGLLALHCRSVADVAELATRHGIAETVHVTVADSLGGIIGIENTGAGMRILEPTDSLYVHANAICQEEIAAGEIVDGEFSRPDSLHRRARLRDLLQPEHGELTAASIMAALADHDGFPVSICRHQSDAASTTAAVVVEPSRGRLHCTLGHPCRHRSHTYIL